MLKINGRPYFYDPKDLEIADFEAKFVGIAKHSVGRALQWIKSNAVLDPEYKGIN